MEGNQGLPRKVLVIDFLEWLRCRMTRAYGSSVSAMSLKYIPVVYPDSYKDTLKNVTKTLMLC